MRILSQRRDKSQPDFVEENGREGDTPSVVTERVRKNMKRQGMELRRGGKECATI
jgi:hypothetical protein